MDKKEKKAGKKEKNKEGKETELEEKRKEIQELTETVKRVQAEFENYRKRIERDREDLCRSAGKEMILKLLPVLDNFELALSNKDNKEEFVKGVELIYSQLMSTLENEGVRRIDAKGQKFDPYNHEALLQEESDKEPGTVVEELQKGYMIGDKILRLAKVKIAKKRGDRSKDGAEN
ncbi:nucleotide exchange factor GrpE [Candidatus Woesearchaeota archaeon]|nr:nucleotide exchange factor GrpE [Candidatus Woesearchaeota archaeon]